MNRPFLSKISVEICFLEKGIVTSQKGREISFDRVRLSSRRSLRIRTLSWPKGVFPQIIEKIQGIPESLQSE
jgi:hypothetical protein